MNISSFSGLEYPGSQKKTNGASGQQAGAGNTTGTMPSYQQYSGQYSHPPPPLPLPTPPTAYGAPGGTPYAQQPYNTYGAMYGQYPYMDPATYQQYYNQQMGYHQQYYQQQQQQQYHQPPLPQAPSVASSSRMPPPPPAVTSATAPARPLGPAPAAYAAQPSTYGQRHQRPPLLPPAPGYQYGMPAVPPPPPQQPGQQQYPSASNYSQSAGTAAPVPATSGPPAANNASKPSELVETKQVDTEQTKPTEAAAHALAADTPFNFDLPKHKVRLNSSNRKDGWHKYLSDEDRPLVEKILREAVEFDDEFINFEKEMKKMTTATSSLGDNSLHEYNSMWENWKKNLLARSEQMMKLMEFNLDNHYKKVCQNYPLFITKPADDTPGTTSSPAEKPSALLPDPVPAPANSRPLLPNPASLLPTPVPQPVQQQPPARKNNTSKYNTGNNKTVPLISGNAGSPLLSAPPGREKISAAVTELFPDQAAKTAAVYSTGTAREVNIGNNSNSRRASFNIPGVSIHDMGKVEMMLLLDDQVSKAIMGTINDVEFQSAHNDFSFLRHQAKFMHDVIMYQKVRPKKNLGSLYVNHISESSVPYVAKQRPPQVQAPSASSVAPPASAGSGDANLSLLDNALDNALKLLKERRASNGGELGGGVDSKGEAIVKQKHPAGISKTRYDPAQPNNISTLTSFKATKPIQVAFSSKSKYNSLTAINATGALNNLLADGVEPVSGQKQVSMTLQPLGPGNLKSKSVKSFVLAADEENLEELEAKGRLLLNSIPSGRPARGRSSREKGGTSSSQSDRDRDRARDWERDRDRGRGHDYFDRDRERERDKQERSSREPDSRSHSSRRDGGAYEGHRSSYHSNHHQSSPPPSAAAVLPYRSSFKSTYFEGNSNGSAGGGGGFPAAPGAPVDFSADIETFLKQERAQLEKNSEQVVPPPIRLSYTDSGFFNKPRKFSEEPLYLSDLLEPPTRYHRPPRIVLIIRGLPGSGKSTLARAIKEEEEALSPLSKIRLLSLDDYFVVEKAFGEELQLVYEYDQAKESDYKCNLFKAFRKTLLSGYGDFVIVDSVNASLTDVRHYYACAVENNFIPYVIEMEAIVRRLLDDCIAGEEIIARCYKLNRHGRSLVEIRALYDSWELLPPDYLRVDAYALAQKLAEKGTIGPEVPRFRPKMPFPPAEQENEVGQQQVLTVHSDYDTDDVPTYQPSVAPLLSSWTASDNGSIGGRPPLLQQQQNQEPPSHPSIDLRDMDAFLRKKRQSPASGGGGQEDYSSYGEYKRSRFNEVPPPNIMNEPSPAEYGYLPPSFGGGDPSRGGQYHHHYPDHHPPPHSSQYMSEQEYHHLQQQRAHHGPPPPSQDYSPSYYDSQPPTSSNYY